MRILMTGCLTGSGADGIHFVVTRRDLQRQLLPLNFKIAAECIPALEAAIKQYRENGNLMQLRKPQNALMLLNGLLKVCRENPAESLMLNLKTRDGAQVHVIKNRWYERTPEGGLKDVFTGKELGA